MIATLSVVAHLVNDRGLELVPEAERRSALPDAAIEAEGSSAPTEAVSEPGRLVFVYRKTPPDRSAPHSNQAAFQKHAA